jgi:hypothetical protein
MQGQGVAQEGYKFLLRDAHSQLWVLLRRYIANAEQRSGAAPTNIHIAHWSCSVLPQRPEDGTRRSSSITP